MGSPCETSSLHCTMEDVPRHSLGRREKVFTVVFLLLLLRDTQASDPSNKDNNSNNDNCNNNKKNNKDNNGINPMDMYVNEEVGVSLVHEDNGVKFFSTFFHSSSAAGTRLSRFKSEANNSFTRILVRPSTQKNVYPMVFTYRSSNSDSEPIAVNKTSVDMRVHQNGDGTVSLACVSNGKFMAWGDGSTETAAGDEKKFNVVKIEGSKKLKTIKPPFCIEDGICPFCRYTLDAGSITDLKIRIVNVTFGTLNETSAPSPDQVAESDIINYGPTTVSKDTSVSYTKSESDETNWEHSWGLEMSAELTIKTVFKISAKLSYNGKEG